MQQIIFIRHGMTAGNERKAYIGSTDEPLSESGATELCRRRKGNCYPTAEQLFVSPMKRCIQTAEMLYPKLTEHAVVIPEFRECDFGFFEGKTYEQLKDDAVYRKWIADSSNKNSQNGQVLEQELFAVGAESRASFQKRCEKGFYHMVDLISQDVAVCIVHGGTIMAIMERFGVEKRSFYEYQCNNGDGILTELCFTEQGNVGLKWIRGLLQ